LRLVGLACGEISLWGQKTLAPAAVAASTVGDDATAVSAP
jgi:hypothetical protein